ncbi:MAG TPA: two-component regulator propeller domain-containing protein [Bryobacteraceae bacterium]|nr:two-component regulator propeller domain-containing protein [Bryobacteraceae bacterium]
MRLYGPLRRWCVPVSLAAAFVLSTQALAQRYTFRYYGQNEGLDNYTAMALFQDRAGYLWVGTQAGAFRYDGSYFQQFDKSEGLPGNFVYCIRQTSDGTIWVFTDGGVARLVGTRFETFEPLRTYRVNVGAIMDTDDAGSLYVGMSNGLAVVSQNGDGQWRMSRVPGTLDRTVWSVYADRDESIWFGCEKGVCRLKGSLIEAYGPRDGVPPEDWLAITGDRTGNIWVRSAHSIITLDPGANSFRPADVQVNASDVVQLGIDPGGDVCIPSSRGLYYKEGGSWRVLNRARGLVGDSQSACGHDREGSFWIAGYGTGLARWVGKDRWTNWTAADGLRNDSVWALAQDRSGDLWVGTDDGLHQFRRGKGDIRIWTTRDGLGGNRVRGLATDGDGNVWIGTYPGGVTRLNPSTGRATVFAASAGLADDRIDSIAWDSGTRTLWVGTQQGLAMGTLSGNSVHFEHVDLPPSGTAKNIYRTIIARSGRIWVGGSYGLAYRENGVWRRLTTKDGLSSDRVQDVMEAPNGDIWVAYYSGSGVGHLRWTNGRFEITNVDRSSGLSSDETVAIAIDHEGWVWVGSDKGLDVLRDGKWEHYSQADGLAWDDCDPAMLTDDQGDVWIATSRGVSRFRHVSQGPTIAPPAMITAVRTGSKQLNDDERMRIPSSNGALQFSFTALTFQNENATRFRYRIAGFEPDWTEIKQRDVRYAGLPAGSYTFEVVACNAHGVWSDTPAKVDFRILAPWYVSWWFRLSAGAALIVLIAGVSWSKNRLARAQRVRLEAMVRQRTQELEEEKHRTEQASLAKSQFLANMSHEIRTPMNGVLGMLQLLAPSQTTSEQHEYLDAARSSAESLLVLLNDILDLSKIEAGKLELEAIPFSLEHCVEGAVQTVSTRAREKGLDLRWTIDPAVSPFLTGDPVRLRQVLINLLGNAVKFTEQGRVALEVDCVGTGITDAVTVHFAVADTGIGIAPEKQAAIFEAFSQADTSTTRKFGGTGLGLSICSRLVQIMGGRIWVESKPETGSTFHFTAAFRATTGLPSLTENDAIQVHVRPRSAQTVDCLRVLVAEDNPINQKVVVRLLERRGHSVVIAENGRRAVDFAKDPSFDVILMDVQMPEMDGFEATQAIREWQQAAALRVPIIAMTACAMAGDQEKCLDAGMDAYITKPVDAEQLYSVIERFTTATTQ